MSQFVLNVVSLLLLNIWEEDTSQCQFEQHGVRDVEEKNEKTGMTDEGRGKKGKRINKQPGDDEGRQLQVGKFEMGKGCTMKVASATGSESNTNCNTFRAFAPLEKRVIAR